MPINFDELRGSLSRQTDPAQALGELLGALADATEDSANDPAGRRGFASTLRAQSEALTRAVLERTPFDMPENSGRGLPARSGQSLASPGGRDYTTRRLVGGTRVGDNSGRQTQPAPEFDPAEGSPQ